MHFDPFVPFQRFTANTERRRYRIESFVGGAWVVVANKNGDLDDAIIHCANSYSARVRIYDVVIGRSVYEREANQD